MTSLLELNGLKHVRLLSDIAPWIGLIRFDTENVAPDVNSPTNFLWMSGIELASKKLSGII